MSIINLSVNRPVTIWMFMFAVFLFGMVSFSRLAIKLLPDLNYPTITIRTAYIGAAPVEVEQLVSKPIEEAVGVVKGLRKISSVSRSGLSDVILEFEWGSAMDMASLDIREKLDTVILPLDIEKPLLLRFNPNLDPIVRLALSVPNATTEQLKQQRTYATEELKRELEALTGVAAVRLSGGLEQEVHIELNQLKLSQLNINADLIRQRIQQENINLSAGKVVQGDKEYLVRTLNQFSSLEELGQIIVYRHNHTLVRLAEIAKITNAHKERDDITRIGEQESIELAIYKEGDANTVTVAKKVIAKIDALNKTLMEQSQEGSALTVIYDQSEFIQSAVKEVTLAAALGSLLAMLVIYLFLRDIIATVIVSLSIPLSVIATFNMMYFNNISLNIMSLGGIALAVGLLVDNAIVVLENIDRCRQEGMGKLDAALKGTQEVSGAIFASTLTTLAVFVPLIFVDGIAGALFSDQALTVTFALITSLIVALTTIPMLASREGFKSIAPDNKKVVKPFSATDTKSKLKHYAIKVISSPFVLIFSLLPTTIMTVVLTLSRLLSWLLGLLTRPFISGFNLCYRQLERLYHRLLELALHYKRLTLSIAVAITLIAGALIPRLGVELIPPMNQGQFYVEVLLPPGTEVAKTDSILKRLALAINKHPQVKQLYSQAGSGGLMSSDTSRGGENWGRLQVVLIDAKGFEEVANILRHTMAQIPELDGKLQHPELFSFKTPLEIELVGYDLAQLKQGADQLVNTLATSTRFTDINTSLRDGQPELTIRFDHQRLAALEMDAPTVANRIAQRIGGTIASQYTVKDRKVDILVRSSTEERDHITDIDSMIINPNSQHPIALSAVADITLSVGPSAINRINQQRVAIVSANLAYGDLNSAITEAASLLNSEPLPVSIQARFGGQSEEVDHSFNSLQIALLLAIALVYLVMASQFESLLHPLLILIAIPIAIAGAIFGLYITQTNISIVVFIGLILLAGIVVNNAIVLVDRINQLRQKGLDKIEAIRQAAHSRLRPIMMTTMTTILGLLPMAIGIGDGSEIRAPMAITVIFGMLLSTLLTLIIIPVLYALFDRKRYAVQTAELLDSSGVS